MLTILLGIHCLPISIAHEFYDEL